MATALSLKRSYLYAREEPTRDRRVRYEAKNPRTLRRASVELKIDKGALEDSEDGRNSDWETIKAVLNFLGYEPKFVHATLISRLVISECHQIIQLSASQIDNYHQNRKRIVTIQSTPGSAGSRCRECFRRSRYLDSSCELKEQKSLSVADPAKREKDGHVDIGFSNLINGSNFSDFVALRPQPLFHSPVKSSCCFPS